MNNCNCASRVTASRLSHRLELLAPRTHFQNRNFSMEVHGDRSARPEWGETIPEEDGA
jgi:hypothetical protein